MTPEVKAEYLIEKFIQYTPADEDIEYEYAKQCALIAVEEMLNEYPIQVPKDSYEMERHLYWQEVKQEIEKL